MPKKSAAKKASAKKATMPKATFVRSQPEDMPAEEVIAKGKARGILLNKMAVYKARSNARKAANKSSASANGTGPKPAANGAPKGKGKGKAPDKKNRVLKLLAQHPTWKKTKIAEKAHCTPNYVYSVLSESGQTGGKSAGPAAGNGAMMGFYRAVKSVGGIGKAKELLANIEAFQSA
jgi:hypothetical protein